MSNQKGFLIVFLLILAPIAINISGCANADKELGDATTALGEARDAGALEFAPEEYQEAESLIDQAKALIAQGNYTEARDLLVQARYKAIEAKWKAIEMRGEMEMKRATEDMSELERIAREKQLEQMKARGLKAERGMTDIFFDYDKSDIKADSRPHIEQNADYIINSAGNNIIVIEGYCDIRGTDEYNLALGQRRADSVKAFLVGLGVSPARLEAVSRGETEQFGAGETERAYQENRRAHFVTAK